MSPVDERERQSIVLDLGNEDDDVRRLGVERISSLDPEEALSWLVALLGDESWRVRKSVVERITAWSDSDAIAVALIGALADGENPGRRNSAVDALIRTGRAAVPRLIEAISHNDPDVRKFVVDVLAAIGDESALDDLVGRLRDGDPNVRAAAADALGAIGGDQAATAIVATAVNASEDLLVRFSALRAIGGLDLPLPARKLASALSDPVLRPAALEAIGLVRDDAEADDVLLKALTRQSRASRESSMRSLLARLGRLDGAEVDSLALRIRETAEQSPDLIDDAIDRLAEADLPIRLVLAQFLGLAGQARAAVPLLRAAADEALEAVVLPSLVALGEEGESEIGAVWGSLDVVARRSACRYFSQANGDASVPRLLAALEDTDPSVRSEAAMGLARRGVVSAAGALVTRLSRTSQTVDLEAEDECQTLTAALVELTRKADEHSASGTIELMAAALPSASDPVRAAIARVVAQLGRPADAELIALLLKDPFSEVRRAAVEALAGSDLATVSESLHFAIADESAEVRIAAAQTLESLGDPGVLPDLRRLAQDEDARVRGMATRAIGLCFGGDADASLSDQADVVLNHGLLDEAPVALAALEVIRERRLSLDHVKPLLQREEPEIVRETIRCLGSHGDLEDMDYVIPLCGHDDWSVRAEAIQVLADRRVSRAVPQILRRLDLERDDFVRRVTLQSLERLEG